jgi:8-oxo-dGTP pyrophosphatase MutT (NUDIX family)
VAHAYLALTRTGAHGGDEVLLAQKNIYLPPCGKYQYATIAGHAVQCVLPGGRIQPGETPAAAAVREFFEDTGVELSPSDLHPLLDDGDQFWTFTTRVSSAQVDVDAINAQLPSGKFGSLKFNNLLWSPVESAPARLGNHESYKALPWVSQQITRALQAGFSRELIGMRANESHVEFTRAIAKLMLETYAPLTAQAPAPHSAPPTPAAP